MLVAFDQTIGMDYRMNAFVEWFKDDGVLKISFKKHTVVFTVGSDSYTVDGQTKKLSQPIHTTDGLPMIPMKDLAAAADFTFAINENGDVVIETPEKAYYDELAKSRKEGEWEFNTLGDSEGWASAFMNLAVDDGYMACESLTQSNDPTILYKKDLALLAKKYSVLEFRVRYKYTGGKNALTMYFSTDRSPGMNEDKTASAVLKSNDSGGEWETYTIDLKNNAFWKDTITALRFDPFNAYGHIDVDYIRFVVDPDYDQEAEAKKAAQEEQARLAAEEEERKLGVHIKNGDAEGETIGFSSETGKVSIVEDPTNPKNHCYLFMPTHDGQVWLYANHKETYTPGKTYKANFDVMLASHGQSTELSADFRASLIPNIRFKDPDGSTDHGLGDNRVTAYAGKWTHVEFEFTVPVRSTDRSGDQFCLYADPVQSKGVGFYLDNVTLTEVEK